MKRPLVGISIFFILGILSAKFIHVNFIVLLSLAILFFAGSLLSLKFSPRLKFLILASFFLLGVCFLKNSETLPKNHVEKYIGYKGRSVIARGKVVTDPVIKDMGYSKKASFVFDVKQIKYRAGWHDTCGKILVNSFQKQTFSYGQEMILQGKLYKAPKLTISKNFDYREYLKRKQIFGILSVKRNSPLEIISENHANPVKELSSKIRNKLSRQIDNYLPSVESSLLRAMLLGERQDIPRSINDIFVKTGTIHILAISGLHIGIIAFLILILLKVMRIPRKPRYIATMLFLIIYVFITGGRVSVIRATIMATVFLGGFLFEREADILNSLALACLLILGFNPCQLFDVGFQLSFVSVISIAVFSPKVYALLRNFPIKNKALDFILRSISVSLAVWLGTLGIIAYYFNIVTPIAIIANLFVIPFMVIVFALGLCFIVISLIFPGFGAIFAGSAGASLFILVEFAHLLSRIPKAYIFLSSLPLVTVFIYYVLLLGMFYLPNFISLTQLWQNRE